MENREIEFNKKEHERILRMLSYKDQDTTFQTFEWCNQIGLDLPRSLADNYGYDYNTIIDHLKGYETRKLNIYDMKIPYEIIIEIVQQYSGETL